jgi:hypothetical protein
MTDELLFTTLILAPGIGAWVLGMWSFLRIGKQAGIAYTRPSAAFRIYKHAFTAMRASRETKLMVLGFAGMFLFPAMVAVLLFHAVPWLK